MRNWMLIVTLIVCSAMIASCVNTSGGAWYVDEAPLPEGWPANTPIGKIEVKPYPAYRAAVVEQVALDAGNTDGMFMTLFNHIKDREIAMTAPVAMGYSPDAAAAGDEGRRLKSMSFLYRRPTQGQLENDGAVTVRDHTSARWLSIGVRGKYSESQYQRHVDLLNAWLDEHDQSWERTGQPRYLGYNSPFVPSFLRYGEVQIPVRQTGK